MLTCAQIFHIVALIRALGCAHSRGAPVGTAVLEVTSSQVVLPILVQRPSKPGRVVLKLRVMVLACGNIVIGVFLFIMSQVKVGTPNVTVQMGV